MLSEWLLCLSSMPVQPCVNLNRVLLGLWHCESLKINVGLRNVRHPELKEPVSIERHFNGAVRFPITRRKTVSCINEAKPALLPCLSFVSLMIGIPFKSMCQPELYFVTVYFFNITACLWYNLLLCHLCLQGHFWWWENNVQFSIKRILLTDSSWDKSCQLLVYIWLPSFTKTFFTWALNHTSA